MNVAAIIVAAGRGERAGKRTDKVLQELCGRTVLARSVDPFLKEPRVVQIILVTPAGREEEFKAKAFPDGLPEAMRVAAVAGGERRRDSVANGLAAIGDAVGLVAVHDAARPLHTLEVLTALIDAALKTGAAVPVRPVTDTILTVAGASNDDGSLAVGPERALLRAVQTPQVFRRDWLAAAHASSGEASDNVTDDATLILRAGHPVVAVEGFAHNIKLTTELDFVQAEAILKQS